MADKIGRDATDIPYSKGEILDVSEAISGQITVTTAGDAEQGPDVALDNGVYIRALSGNDDVVYVGNDGSNDITSANSFELSSAQMVIIQVSNLNELWFDVATSSDKLCWLKA